MEWVPTSVLAKALEKTERSVQRLALRQGWRFREMPCRGGMRREYHLPSLSQEVQRKVAATQAQQQPRIQSGGRIQETALQQAQASAQEADLNGFIEATAGAWAAEEKEKERIRLARHQESLAQFHQLPQWQQKYALAKWEVLKAYETFMFENRFPLRRGQELFINEYSIQRVEIPEEARAIYPKISLGSLHRWIQEEYRHGLIGLIDNYGYHRQGRGIIEQDPYLQKLIRGYLDQTPHIRHTHLLQAIKAKCPQYRDLTLSTLNRWLQRMMQTPEGSYWRLRQNPSQWRHREQVAFGDADADIVRLNQLWEMDSTPADVMLEGSRHHVLAVIDVYSRRMKLLVSKTSGAAMVGTLLRRALLAWGVPEVVRMDNGKEYVSDYIERLLHDLAITPEWCRPRCPEEKPFIEAGIKTFCYGLLELKRDYIGHSVAERKALQDSEAFMKRMSRHSEAVPLRMSAADLQAFCDDWCEAVYGRDPHEGLGGQTPFERAATWREPIRKIENERALDILLTPIPRAGGRRMITPKGIELDRGWYISDALIPYIGQWGFCRHDPDDIGRIYVFGGPDSTFLAIATCPQRADLGISQKEAAHVAHARQKELLQEIDRRAREARKAITSADPAESVLAYRKEQAARVVELPHASVPYETPAIKEAAAAVRAAERRINPPTATVSPENHEKFLRAMERYEAREQIEEPRDRYKQLWKLEAGARTQEEEAWMRTFEKTPTGRATKFFLEDREESLRQAALDREKRKASAR